jgi:hypothetical protein
MPNARKSHNPERIDCDQSDEHLAHAFIVPILATAKKGHQRYHPR